MVRHSVNFEYLLSSSSSRYASSRPCLRPLSFCVTVLGSQPGGESPAVIRQWDHYNRPCFLLSSSDRTAHGWARYDVRPAIPGTVSPHPLFGNLFIAEMIALTGRRHRSRKSCGRLTAALEGGGWSSDISLFFRSSISRVSGIRASDGASFVAYAHITDRQIGELWRETSVQ